MVGICPSHENDYSTPVLQSLVEKILHEHGFNATSGLCSPGTDSPIHTLCRHGTGPLVQHYLQSLSPEDRREQLELRGRRQWTPLHVVAYYGNAGVVGYLLGTGLVDIDALGNYPSEAGTPIPPTATPLHLSVVGADEMGEVYLDLSLTSFLHRSADTEVTSLLLTHGANAHLRPLLQYGNPCGSPGWEDGSGGGDRWPCSRHNP